MMPRVADPQLAARLLNRALRILDKQGMEAVSMRSVASAAGVTTGAIYERFANRESMLHAVFGLIEKDLHAAVLPALSVENLAKQFIRYYCLYPHRFELNVMLFDHRLATGERKPVYEVLGSLLTSETGVTGQQRNHLALAIASLTFGTIRSMIAAGPDTRNGKQLRQSALTTLSLLISSLSAQGKRQDLMQNANPSRDVYKDGALA